MRVKIHRGRAFGTIAAPASKSMAHRLLICAAMAEGESRILGVPACDDVLATADCLRALGVEIKVDGCDYTVKGRSFLSLEPSEPLLCRESGSTLRMMMPAAALSGRRVEFRASEGLLRRPMTVYSELYASRGLDFRRVEGGYSVKGALTPDEYTLPGNVSSQFISGLILALGAGCGTSTVKITAPIESRSYIDLTLYAMRRFGCEAYFSDENTITVSGGGYKPCRITVEGDFSGAAFPDALNIIGGSVQVLGLAEDSMQGDKVYKDHFRALSEGTPTLDLTDCPDLAPILFALAARLRGARFLGTRRLKIKESDRAEAMRLELEKLGGRVTVFEDSVTVEGGALTAPEEPISSHNDHRIAMAMAILLTELGGEIEGAEAIAKSYPEFWSHLQTLNIDLEIYE